MDLALFELPFFPLLFLPEESTLSQLPFFSEDCVANSCLPPRPSSVCEACWEGPFAMHFGLPLMSPRNGKWYRRWPGKNTYVTTWAKLKSRADAGCVWCRFLLRMFDSYTSRKERSTVTVTVRGTVARWRWAEGSDPSHMYQQLTVGSDRSEELVLAVYTDPGALGTGVHTVFLSQVEGWS